MFTYFLRERSIAVTSSNIFSSQCRQASRDGTRFIEDLRRSVSRSTGFDAVMRVRASTGLRPTGFFGAFYMSNTTDIELGNIDSDKAIAVEIKHDDKLREDDIAFFQVTASVPVMPQKTMFRAKSIINFLLNECTCKS